MMEKNPRVELVPWDYESREHLERMFRQRLACGWRSDDVHESWARLGREGRKAMYWVVNTDLTNPPRAGGSGDWAGLILESQVLRDDFPDREKLLAQHVAGNPEEPVHIHDTAQTHWLQPRLPTGRPIHPVGHIALDLRAEQNAALNLTEDGIIWVASLFISWPLQTGGLGREAMQLTETIASQPPLLGQWVVLDSMSHEQQMSPLVAEQLIAQGRPAPTMSNQEWYQRQGYQVFRIDRAGCLWANPATGDEVGIDVVFLKKKL